jgi:hypothetical protein
MSESPLTARQRADGVTMAAISDARSPFVRKGVEYWQSLCGQRRFPARGDLTLRGMAPFLPHTVIIGVIGGGADYDYRYVGEAEREAFKTYFKGIRLTQIEAYAPEFGGILRRAYEQVRSTGLPFIVRGRSDLGNSQLSETAFLPLGAGQEAVDHLLIVGVQIPEPFRELPADKLQTLVDLTRAPAFPARGNG